jgi:hypothetical protein
MSFDLDCDAIRLGAVLEGKKLSGLVGLPRLLSRNSSNPDRPRPAVMDARRISDKLVRIKRKPMDTQETEILELVNKPG